jgi:hypothetical protein
MFDSLTSRATFYDITGYLVPGICAEGVAWLWLYAFRPEPAVALLSGPLWKGGGFVVAVLLVATGYIAGHLVNDLSCIIIQKWLFRKPFARAMDWRTRSLKNSPKRMDRIRERSFELYGLLPEDLKTFDLRIRGEEGMPQSFVTGFSFLSFYGMNRTLSLLCVLASVPCCELARRTGLLPHPAASVFLALALTVGSAALFLHQYLRFVEYYYNYLGSTLLVRSKLDSKN